jgi:hypothetical protein
VDESDDFGVCEPEFITGVFAAEVVASLEITLTDEEAAKIEAPYTPRYDFQGISDDAVLARISARLGIKP